MILFFFLKTFFIIFNPKINFDIPSTDEILKVYKLGETPPPIKEFKNTLKSPSGEPEVGSGNFTVKKP